MKGKRAPFMSVQNYQHIVRVLEKYTAQKGLSADDYGIRLDRLVYKTMTDVDADHPTMTVLDKNRMTADVVANFIVNVANSVQATDARPPTAQPLACAGGDDFDLAGRMERLKAARNDVDLGDPYADFQSAVLRSIDATGTHHAALRPDLVGMRNNVGACDGFAGAAGAGDGGGSAGGGGSGGGGDPFLIPPPKGPSRIVRRYLLVNGYDRHWNTYPERFRFTVNLANSDADFKKIRSVAATRLIVPMEIVEEKTITSRPKTVFEQPFNLQYPYVILKIADFQSVYKASNPASQSAFCHFVYRTHYVSPNGRGYIVMDPMQDETMEFHINPLSHLSVLDLAVQRPSGALINESRDQSVVMRMDWNNQVNMNRQLIMVTLRSYFDRNEFYKGDTVRFTNFAAPSTALASFVNRPQGHEILEFGTPNPDGYVNSFYVRVPGEFNPGTGLFDIDTDATRALMDHVASIDYESPPANGIALVINASLQVAVSFEVRVEEEDVSI